MAAVDVGPLLLTFLSPTAQPEHFVPQSPATGSTIARPIARNGAPGAFTIAAATVAAVGLSARSRRRGHDRLGRRAISVEEYRRTKDYGVDDYIREYEIVVFGSACPYCKRAVAALQDAGYNVKNVGCVKGTQLRAELDGVTGSSSVPKVFVKGTLIGGCDDGAMGGVIKCLENGKIAELLA
mmetsp:Transcript_575/g.1443  ORF Transcript_575/g.1443 Transcript_575/m.1443 type:complete len:182 (+) Transcript_575:72-617(+)